MSTPAPPPFDLAHLRDQTFADEDLARELLTLLDGQIVALLTVIAQPGDARTRSDAAHTLKGGARAVGAFALADAAAAVEETLARGGPGPGANDLATLAAQAQAARRAIASWSTGDVPLAFPPSLS
jgi:HPt (histidine-containing phosphotransfer) domain-containing protein